MTSSHTPTATQVRDAMNMLSSRAQNVLTAEIGEKRASLAHSEATGNLERARNLYDEALEAALEIFPALTTGYNLNPETVGIGADGKVHVMSIEETG